MEFKEFKEKMQSHFAQMVQNQDHLFVVDYEPNQLWELYLNSFPPGTNEVFRKSREFDCSCCRHFVKSFGGVVALRGGRLISIWEFDPNDFTYNNVCLKLSQYIHSRPVVRPLITPLRVHGTPQNVEWAGGDAPTLTWHHFSLQLPDRLIASIGSKTVGELTSQAVASKEVFKRSLEEITPEAVETVLELIAQKTLYKGDEWKAALEQFQRLQRKYLVLSSQGDNFCWEQSQKIGPSVSRIKNHSIGTLLMDISEGMDLDQAVRRYESVTAPSNYKRPKAIFTKKMLEQAKAKAEELGISGSLLRRFAVLDDIKKTDVFFSNKDTARREEEDAFSALGKKATSKPQTLSKIDEVDINDFLVGILPHITSIEVLFEKKHFGNLVSLIAPQDATAKGLFKWKNPFSWAYNGNITDSMKERVKAAGGDVDGVLRFSIQWNENGDNPNDFDAHCSEPNGNHIYFQNKGHRHPSSGMLDVDIINPGDKVAVENITWNNQSRMPEGIYEFYVHNFNHCGGRSGFSAEIEFDGQVYSFDYPRELRQKEGVQVASVSYSSKDGFKIQPKLDSTSSSATEWELQTNQFYPVSLLLNSPNYWEGAGDVGHKHVFFIIPECFNTTRPNGFFNEFLPEELMEHKHVFEALGSQLRVPDSENQLSGLGFSTTKRDSLICKVKGSFTRTIKLTF
jgi:hypothetical protein